MKRAQQAGEQSRGVVLLRLGLFGIGFAAASLWLVFLWTRRNDPGVWHKDWLCFYEAGRTFVASGAESAYAGQCIDGYFWLYPPYMLYPYAVASMLRPLVFYSLIVVEVIGLTVWSLRVLEAVHHPRRPDFRTFRMFVIGSAALFTTLVAGQHSALLLAALAGAVWAESKGRRFEVGLFLGLLAIKPNWAILVVVWLVVTRRWRELGGVTAVGSVMLLSTLPIGFGTWEAYLGAGPDALRSLLNSVPGETSYPVHKLATFEAFTRSTIGLISPLAAKAAWVALEILAAAACLIVWSRSRVLAEQLAITVLTIVAANIYVEFYDILVLTVPAAVWWTGRDRYSKTARRLVVLAMIGIWIWQWTFVIFPSFPWPSLTGGFLVLWIAGEVLRHARRPFRRAVPEVA